MALESQHSRSFLTQLLNPGHNIILSFLCLCLSLSLTHTYTHNVNIFFKIQDCSSLYEDCKKEIMYNHCFKEKLMSNYIIKETRTNKWTLQKMDYISCNFGVEIERKLHLPTQSRIHFITGALLSSPNLESIPLLTVPALPEIGNLQRE